MDECNMNQVIDKIKNSDKKVSIIYAFNGTGKTRISMMFDKLTTSTNNNEEIKQTIYYNSFIEDLFTWDNENYKLKISKGSVFIDLIQSQGKENEIAQKFKNLTRSKIDPYIDIKNYEIRFSLQTGDNDTQENIKISRGEESLFIWSCFHVLMESIIFELNEEIEDRSTNEFDHYKYIFIDDPISSLDDDKAIDVALEIVKLIKGCKSDLRFIITTHHALFYNILHTELHKANRWWLVKNENNYRIKELRSNETPFGYHLLLKEEIENAINSNNVKRYHFNCLRNLLEKTAHFLGYHNWKELIQEENKEAYIKRINFYCHSNHSALDSKELQDQEIAFLNRIFNKFLDSNNWKKGD